MHELGKQHGIYWFCSRYNQTSGKFTADRAGLYHFHQHWVINPWYDLTLYIMKNEEPMCKSFGSSDGDSDYNSPSCSVTLGLLAGDEIYVVSDVYGSVGGTTSTGFTGFLIKAYV